MIGASLQGTLLVTSFLPLGDTTPCHQINPLMHSPSVQPSLAPPAMAQAFTHERCR